MAIRRNSSIVLWLYSCLFFPFWIFSHCFQTDSTEQRHSLRKWCNDPAQNTKRKIFSHVNHCDKLQRDCVCSIPEESGLTTDWHNLQLAGKGEPCWKVIRSCFFVSFKSETGQGRSHASPSLPALLFMSPTWQISAPPQLLAVRLPNYTCTYIHALLLCRPDTGRTQAVLGLRHLVLRCADLGHDDTLHSWWGKNTDTQTEAGCLAGQVTPTPSSYFSLCSSMTIRRWNVDTFSVKPWVTSCLVIHMKP